jgi:hypothetical protein
MSCFSGNKYLCNIYQRNAIKLNQYLKHITTFADFDNATFTYEKNTSTIAGSQKFGIFFEHPCNTSELYTGKIGELNENHITAYYANFFGCEISKKPDYIEFRDDCTGLLVTCEGLPDLNNDIPPQSISTDSLITIKSIVEKYRNFYSYMYKKTCCKDDDSFLFDCDKKKCDATLCCENKYNSTLSNNSSSTNTTHDTYKNKFLHTINTHK